jgi:hypothetical protein
VEMAQNIPHSVRTHIFELYGVKVDGLGAPIGKVLTDSYAYCILKSMAICSSEGFVFALCIIWIFAFCCFIYVVVCTRLPPAAFGVV